MFKTTGNRMTSIGTTDKPFRIEKRQVYEAYKAVKANQGAAGVDGQTLEMFEKDLAGNLYKVWNRMSSGTSHRRFALSPFRRRVGAKGFWVCPPSAIGSHRW